MQTLQPEMRPGFRVFLAVREDAIGSLPQNIYSWCSTVSARAEPSQAECIVRCLLQLPSAVSRVVSSLGVKDADLQRLVAVRWFGLCLFHTSLVGGWITAPCTGQAGFGVTSEDLIRCAHYVAYRTEGPGEARQAALVYDLARTLVNQCYSLGHVHPSELERLSVTLGDLWISLAQHLRDVDVEVLRHLFTHCRSYPQACESLFHIIVGKGAANAPRGAYSLSTPPIMLRDPFPSPQF